MLKYYKEFFSGYEFSSVIQTVTLIAMLTFFVVMFIRVFKKPKGFYRELEESPLDFDIEENEKNNKP